MGITNSCDDFPESSSIHVIVIVVVALPSFSTTFSFTLPTVVVVIIVVVVVVVCRGDSGGPGARGSDHHIHLFQKTIKKMGKAIIYRGFHEKGTHSYTCALRDI